MWYLIVLIPDLCILTYFNEVIESLLLWLMFMIWVSNFYDVFDVPPVGLLLYLLKSGLSLFIMVNVFSCSSLMLSLKMYFCFLMRPLISLVTQGFCGLFPRSILEGNYFPISDSVFFLEGGPEIFSVF